MFNVTLPKSVNIQLKLLNTHFSILAGLAANSRCNSLPEIGAFYEEFLRYFLNKVNNYFAK